MRIHLKVKVCSLAAESRIIRKLEKKRKGGSKARESLYHHRVTVVRRETRCSHLAYGYLRGREYRQLEHPKSRPVDWARVSTLVAKFGEMDKRVAAQKLAEWSSTE